MKSHFVLAKVTKNDFITSMTTPDPSQPPAESPFNNPDPIPFDRLLAVDLRPLTEEQMMGLKKEAMRRGCSFQTLLAQLIEEITRRIVGPDNHKPA